MLTFIESITVTSPLTNKFPLTCKAPPIKPLLLTYKVLFAIKLLVVIEEEIFKLSSSLKFIVEFDTTFTFNVLE